MTKSSAKQIRNYQGPAIFSFGFRPFFLAGALIAALTPLITAASLSGAHTGISAYGAIAWHGHELIYGYLAAVIAGFLLTAVPNWTGRLPIVGGRLAGLFLLWLAGRLAVFLSGVIGVTAAALADCAFLIVMSGVLWREILTGRNWRNAPVGVLMVLFAAGNIVWHAQWVFGAANGLGIRWGLGVIAILLALIGGRVTPSFTRNWLAKNSGATISAGVSRIDKAALVLAAGGMILWVFAPASKFSGAILIAAAVVNLLRLLRWRGLMTMREPLVAILHVGYCWLVASLLLLGIAAIAPVLMPPMAALHALTSGAAGVMTLAVMTRATRGHTGRALTADVSTSAIYVLVNLGAVIRVAAPLLPMNYGAAIALGASLWSAAFLAFAIIYGRYLITPRLPA